MLLVIVASRLLCCGVWLLVSLGITESLVSSKDVMLAQHHLLPTLGSVSWDNIQASIFPRVFDPAAI